MPTYEYACDACDHQFEHFQSITASPIRTCPECKKRKVRRLISGGSGFLFKGSGFYTTDYRSESYKQAAKKDKEGSSKKDGDSGKKDGDSSKKDSSKKESKSKTNSTTSS
jgi:putative FmdB family regulatory protein